jgi:peptidoglycan hydrolase-like protein with peptidoglycan-binding domain
MLGYVLDVDSEYGPLTAKQVMLFQTDNGLEVDGITGRKTWTAVYSKLSDYVRGVNRVPQYVGRVSATELNVRCFPSALFDRITAWPVLGDGNLIDVCATIEMPDESVWHYVRIAGYIYGFVSAQYIRKK